MDGSPPVHQTDINKPKRYGKAHLRRQGRVVAVATPSPNHWKETLRQSCLQRAKKRRLDLVRRKRQQHDFFNLMQQEATDNEENHARVLVEEELREHGVSMDLDGDDVVNSVSDDCFRTTAPRQLAFDWQSTASKQTFPMEDPSSEYYISEKEINDLMQEVEEELHRNEESLLEEILELERMEQQQIDSKIAEYEEWVQNDHHSVDGSSCRSQCVPCPICQGRGLIALVDENRSFVCSNHRNGCSFRVASNGLCLQQLFDRIEGVYESHGLQCHGVLGFDLETLSHDPKLVARCSNCELNVRVL